MKPYNNLRTCYLLAGAVVLAVGGAAQARADYPSSVLALNPLGYWHFDEVATSPALNSVANSSPLGSIANGCVVGAAAPGEPGIVGNSVRFFHTSSSDVGLCTSKIDVPYNAALNPGPPFTIEFWAKPASLQTYGGDTAPPTGTCPISNFDPNWYGANRSGWLFYMNNVGRWQFRLGTVGGYAGSISGTSGNAAPGVWQHIVATWDGATANLYANGALIGSGAASVANWTDNSESFLRLGGSPLTGTGAVAPANSASSNNGNRGFDGWVDEVAIYPAMLSPASIAAHYAAATTNTAGYDAQILADGPVAYWNLDEPVVTPPDPSTYTYAANSGSLASAADGTNQWGTLAAQPGPGYAGFGPNDKAVFFDGDNGYFQVNDAPDLHFAGRITLMAWIKPTEQDFFRDIIAHGFNNNGAETFLRISRGSGTAGYGDGNYYEIGASDGSSYYDSALFPIPAGDIGNWVFVAGTYDGANWNLYRNGALVATAAPTGADFGAVDVTNRWTIGSRSDPGAGQGQFFGGWINEPAIFNTALSAAQVYALFNAGQVPPVITRAPQDPGAVFDGSSVSFSVWADGSATLNYSWTSNGITTGVTTTNFILSNLGVGKTTVAVTVSNPYGSVTRSVSFTAVTAPPSFVQQPAPVTRFAGYPFSFSATAIGSLPMTYYWMREGTVVQAGPAATYSNIASLANAGSYSVTVSNHTGIAVTSAPAALTVWPVPSGYAGAAIGSSPIAYWRLDEASGPTAHDGIGGHDGAYYSVTLGVPGYSLGDPDTAAQFGAVNSYVGDISGTAIAFPGHKSFTLEAWVNGPAGQPDESTIIAKGIGATGTTRSEQFSLDVAAGVFRFFTSSSTDPIVAAAAGTGPNGTWQHVAGVYDDAGATMHIYVNGVEQGHQATRAAGLVNTTSPISIGSKRKGNDPGYDGFFTGTIDEVAIYNYALDAATILEHYSALYGSGTKPFIVTEPQSTTNYVSLWATFSVNALGSVPLDYQWHLNGGDILGATDSAYTNFSLALSDAGNYTVTISNPAGATNSAVAKLTVLPPPASPVAIAGLVVHLPFDGSLADTTGRGNDGTPKGHISFVNDGALGRALHYSTDPDGGTNYVTLGVRPDLQFSSNVNFTVAYWIRLPLNYTGGDLPFFTDTVGSTFGSGYVFAPTYGTDATQATNSTTARNGGWAMSLFDGSGSGIGVYGDVGSINDGNWHHLVHVFDRTAGNVNYLDGLVAHYAVWGGTTALAAGNIDTGAPATIGQDPNGTYGEYGSADIEDLGVWRKALTPLQAASIYMAAISNKLSYVYVPPPAPAPITVLYAGTQQVILSWPANAGWVLQSADVATGPYTDISAAPNPYTVAPSAAKKFYRLKYQF